MIFCFSKQQHSPNCLNCPNNNKHTDNHRWPKKIEMMDEYNSVFDSSILIMFCEPDVTKLQQGPIYFGNVSAWNHLFSRWFVPIFQSFAFNWSVINFFCPSLSIVELLSHFTLCLSSMSHCCCSASNSPTCTPPLFLYVISLSYTLVISPSLSSSFLRSQ